MQESGETDFLKSAKNSLLLSHLLFIHLSSNFLSPLSLNYPHIIMHALDCKEYLIFNSFRYSCQGISDKSYHPAPTF